MTKLNINGYASQKVYPDRTVYNIVHKITSPRREGLIEVARAQQALLSEYAKTLKDSTLVNDREYIRNYKNYEGQTVVESGFEFVGNYTLNTPNIEDITQNLLALGVEIEIFLDKQVSNKEQISQELIKTAIKDAQTKANYFADILGMKVCSIESINYNGQGHAPVAFRMNAAVIPDAEQTISESMSFVFCLE